MSFIQVIEVRTNRIDELEALDREYEAATAGRHTVRRSIVTRDRNDPDRYLIHVFFDSYESAMANSNMPETAALAEKMGPLLNAPPIFHDLDIIEDRTT
jgi:quinol monooxygenase YgiN